VATAGPRRVSVALAHGGNPDASSGHALVTLAVYVVLVSVATLAVFARRDA
jgi:hypothetical protein